MQDLIIIGGGPAGLSAAMYALGKQLDFLLIGPEPGGRAGARQRLASQGGDEPLPGSEVVASFQSVLAATPQRMIFDAVDQVARIPGGYAVSTARHGRLSCRAIIVASGATPVRLDAPGAAELLGHGLGYSVTTHAHILKGKTVAVIGTTPRALRGVAEIAPVAEKVYLIAPQASAAPPATSLAPQVELLAGWQLTDVLGPRYVSELVLRRNGETRQLAVDAAFVDLGLLANSDCVARLLSRDRDGFILVDDRNATTAPGIFAAGDVTTAFGEQVLIAVGEGARAALSAYDYLLALRGQTSPSVLVPTRPASRAVGALQRGLEEVAPDFAMGED